LFQISEYCVKPVITFFIPCSSKYLVMDSGYLIHPMHFLTHNTRHGQFSIGINISVLNVIQCSFIVYPELIGYFGVTMPVISVL
ncbi:hypothetical protein, partial [Elizabethkingia anophelis]|uniref:hypothetical protein n=1 Tax=Elizabethkingia anophelis TaxID=1117645 RepID=UPI0032091A6F